MARITTKMCGNLPSGISVIRNSGGIGAVAISVDDGRVTVGMMKFDRTTCDKARVNIAMMPDSAGLVEIFGGQGILDWFRGTAASIDGAFTGRDNAITVQFNHPPDVCRWIASRVFGRRIGLSALYISVTPKITGGPIPQDGGAWCPEFEDYDSVQAQCKFIPGEYLFLEWMMKFGSDVQRGIMAGAWFATPAFTGGTCGGVSGEGVNRMVAVTAQGSSGQSVRPTDFADYSAGQWIYLLKQGDADAEATNRQDVYDAEDAEAMSGVLRAAPVRFNDFGPDGMDTLEYNLDNSIDFPSAFEISQHIGTITELWPSSVTPLRDAARIDIDGMGSFDWVDIFYHCENAATVTGGMAAFSVGDEVLVLNEGGRPFPSEDDLVIVGFPDQLKSCGFGIKVASVNGKSDYLKYTAKIRLTQPIAEEISEKGGYTEDYRVLCEVNLDANGVAALDENTFNYPIDPDYPLHVWFQRSSLFDYYTESTVGDYPDVVVDPGDFSYREDINTTEDWAAVQAESWFDDDCLLLDRVWGQRLNLDLRNVSKTIFSAADGKDLTGWQVDVSGIKVIEIADSRIFIPSACGIATGYANFHEKEFRRLDQDTWDLVSPPDREIYEWFICSGVVYQTMYEDLGVCDKCMMNPYTPDYSNDPPGFAVITDKYGQNPAFQAGEKECISSPPTVRHLGTWDSGLGTCVGTVEIDTGSQYGEHIRTYEMVDASENL